MRLLTDAQRKKLIANGLATAKTEKDFYPVVKLFTPDDAAAWLLSEINANDPDQAFGLCDLGMGCPELGYVSLSELEALRGKLGLHVERDRWFEATQPLAGYAEAARAAGRITV